MIKKIRTFAAAAVLVLTGAFLGKPSVALAQNEQEEKNRALIAKSFDAWRDRTGGPYDLLNDNAVWTIVGNSLAAKTYPSREAFLSEVIRPFNARMSTPLTPTVRQLYAEGNTVVAFFDAAGVARDGQPYKNTYAWFLELKDNQIIRAYAFFDSIAFDDFWRRVSPDKQ